VEKMVGQLFELSKMESANFEMQREPFVFSEVLQEVVRAVGAGGIECQNCTDGSYVNADISMMERVLQNLVVNAAAYTPAGGRILIGLDREGGELVFRIENEGEALPAALLTWINGVGERPAKAVIGLAIVKKILALHGFGFGAEVRTEGSGRVNVFSFRMPVYER
jgi:signal transduction histidine kinase